MRVLIIGINYDPEPVGIGPYTTGLARALVEQGHQVQVLTGKPYYPAWRVEREWRRPYYLHSVEAGVRITRCPLYVPRRDSGWKRILHHMSFTAALIPAALRGARRFMPDLVINIAPSMISAPVARMAAKLARAKLWLHVQDFEVEAAFATGLLKHEMAARLAIWFEAKQMQAADRVSTISPQMCRKLTSKGVSEEHIVEFPNWADIDAIQPLATVSAYRAEWSIQTPHVALYSGNIAHKQGIEIIVEAARLLQHRSDLTFVICGEGPNRPNLAALASELGNIRLCHLQPRERLSELLGLASVHLLPQLAGAADLVLPSKLTNMLASGRPVIATADAGTGLAMELDGTGIVTPPGDAAALAAAIERVLDDPSLAARLGTASRRRAEIRWSRQPILDQFIKAVEEVAMSKPKAAVK